MEGGLMLIRCVWLQGHTHTTDYVVYHKPATWCTELNIQIFCVGHLFVGESTQSAFLS